MGKFGKKNEISLNPLKYNICLLGEPKIGKTSTVKKFLEKVGGEESYIFLELNGEAGADAISNIIYEDVNSWDELEEIITDIEDNKTTDYPELKTIVMDTYDGWIELAEKEAIRLWNKTHPDRKSDIIDGVWGGFQKGQKKAFDLMMDILIRLRAVGVSTFTIGHVKNRNNIDAASGASYTTLTSDVENIYFNLLKKKMHFLGLAYYDREIVTEKTGRKNLVTKKDITINKVMSESRKIKWRDDNYSLDSGSRFADIIEETPLDADAMITAINDAIIAEANKGSVSVDDLKKKQDKADKENAKAIAEAEKIRREEKAIEQELSEIIDQIQAYFDANKKNNLAGLKPIAAAIKEMGYANPSMISDIEDAKTILEMCK